MQLWCFIIHFLAWTIANALFIDLGDPKGVSSPDEMMLFHRNETHSNHRFTHLQDKKMKKKKMKMKMKKKKKIKMKKKKKMKMKRKKKTKKKKKKKKKKENKTIISDKNLFV